MIWKNLMFFAGGLAIGGAAGYFVAKELLEEEKTKEINEQIADVKAYYENHMEAVKKAAELETIKKLTAPALGDAGEKEPPATENVTTKLVEEDGSLADGSDEDEWGDAKKPKAVKKQRRNRILDEDDEAPYYEEEGEAAVYPTEPGRKPFFITEQVFSDDIVYSKETFFWFAGDDTVTDDEYSLVEDPTSLLGNDWRSWFGRGDDEDEDVIHVRNPSIGCDYEIIREYKRWIDTQAD